MGTLPDAVPQRPACGACGGETRSDGEHFYCQYCLLGFAPITLIAFFLDPKAETCGAPCDNSWHGDHRIRQGWGYDCGSCGLPAGHESMHWTNCQPKQLTAIPGGSES